MNRTSLREANIGQNKYCGPAVLSILTGKSTDYCANVISGITGEYRITGVKLQHLITALDKMGFDAKEQNYEGSLYRCIVELVAKGKDGIYVLMPPNHYIIVEVKDKTAYFCDNHTKQPIPAASSARLLQRIGKVVEVIKRPIEEVEPNYKYVTYTTCNYCLASGIDTVIHRDYCKYKQWLDFKREQEANYDEVQDTKV